MVGANCMSNLCLMGVGCSREGVVYSFVYKGGHSVWTKMGHVVVDMNARAKHGAGIIRAKSPSVFLPRKAQYSCQEC